MAQLCGTAEGFLYYVSFAGITGAGVTTVVIDTGIDLNHSWFGADADLNGVADRIVFSYDFDLIGNPQHLRRTFPPPASASSRHSIFATAKIAASCSISLCTFPP